MAKGKPSLVDGDSGHTVVALPVRKCATCNAWRPTKNQAIEIFGGCAKSGTTTTHYGDSVFRHYTTDQASCSGWEQK